MARERYLVGVSKEELEYTPPLPPPTTPKGKWENFWYHHKWLVIGVAFAVIVAVVLIVQLVKKDDPDYTICIISEKSLSDKAVERLEREFAACGTDRNGDGEVLVAIQVISLSDAAGTAANSTAHAAIQTHFASRDVVLFAFAPSYYTETLLPLVEENSLSFTAVTVGENELYWNWKGSPLLAEPEFAETDLYAAAPEDLYFAVRDMTASGDEKAMENQQAHTALLEAFMAKYAE